MVGISLGHDARNDGLRRTHHVAVPFIVGWPSAFAIHSSVPALVIVSVDRELAALEQRLHAAIAEFLRRHAAVQFGRELDDEGRLQRSMEDQARIALDPGDVVAVVMDAVAVEGQRRIPKQQHGIADMGLAMLCHRRRRWRLGRRGRGRASHVAIDDILPFADR